MIHRTKISICVLVMALLFGPPNTWAADQPVESRYSFRLLSLPAHLGYDMLHSFWGPQGVVFASTTGFALGFHPLDQKAADWFEDHSVLPHAFNRTWHYLWASYTVGGLALLTWVGARQKENDKLALAMEALVETTMLTTALVHVAKVAVQRERPDGGNYSFPSGHTTTAFSTATVLAAFYGYSVGVPAFLLSGLTAFHRFDFKRHYLTDGLVGAILGVTVGYGTAKFHQREQAKWSVAPWVNEGGLGLVYQQRF